MATTKLYATWEAAEKLGLNRKALWDYHKRGCIEGTLDDEGFTCYTEEQIANAKLPAVTLKHIAERRALAKLKAIEAKVEVAQPAPSLTDEQEDIARWASEPWREW